MRKLFKSLFIIKFMTRSVLSNLHNLYNEKIGYGDLERIKELVSNFYKIPKNTLDRVKMKFDCLPVVYIFDKVGNYIRHFVNIIGGLYNPEKKEIVINKYINKDDKIKAIIHEYVHAAQDYLGKIYKLSREKIEEEAYRVTDELLKIYNQASRKPLSSLGYLVPI
jgi:hypothetical protein